MNEWLVEQLELQSDRLRELAVPDVPSTDWLTGRTAAPQSDDQRNGDGDVDVDVDVDGTSIDHLDGVDADEDENSDEAIVARAADDLRRDDGFDDPPGESTPLWMLDVNFSR
jgi:hypothetical protein